MYTEHLFQVSVTWSWQSTGEKCSAHFTPLMLNQRVPSYLGWLVVSIRHLICKIGSRDWKIMNPMRNLPSYPSVSGFLEFPHTSLPNNQDLLYMIYQVCRFFWDFYTILHSSTLIQRSQRTVCAVAGRTTPRVAAAAGSWNVPQCRGAWGVHGPGETIWQRHDIMMVYSGLLMMVIDGSTGLQTWILNGAHHTYLVFNLQELSKPKISFCPFQKPLQLRLPWLPCGRCSQSFFVFQQSGVRMRRVPLAASLLLPSQQLCCKAQSSATPRLQ